jgi:hypothetical protein
MVQKNQGLSSELHIRALTGCPGIVSSLHKLQIATGYQLVLVHSGKVVEDAVEGGQARNPRLWSLRLS